MQIAFSTNAYRRTCVEDAIARIAAIGYRGVEIMADVPHAWPAGLLPEQKASIRRALDPAGLEISNLNGFMMQAVSDARQPYWHPSWLEPDRHYRRVRVDHTRRCIALAKELGAPSVSTAPGGPLEPGESRDRAMRVFVDELLPAAEEAKAAGVLLLVEPEPGLLIETAAQFAQFMSFIRQPAVGLNFDMGHFYCVGDDPATAIDTLAPYIRHFHIEDIAATRAHHHLIPGDGAIDFVAAFRAMRRIDYDGWVTIELYPYLHDPDQAARIALDRVREALS
jgi:sugar phosphate isomerase/epimerase